MITESKQIQYAKGYKYQLRKTAYFQTSIHPRKDICTDLVSLRQDGLLIIRKYFAWDGASGPTWDDDSNMRASLVHDALYYLIRKSLLNPRYRRVADNLLKQYIIEDGTANCKSTIGKQFVLIRASYYRLAVRWFAGKYATEKAIKPVLTAPEKS